MKFMKLGNRPDTFITTDSARTISSEVPTDLKIHVESCIYHLHKFPLLSKCLRLQSLCAESAAAGGSPEHAAVIRLPAFPGGTEAFETCAKFCYGITVTLSAVNFVPVRCAAHCLQMTDAVDRGNLTGKLDVFFKSCILRRWRDALVALQGTCRYAALCEELGVTGRCIDAAAAMVVNHHSKPDHRPASVKWAEDIAEFGIDLYWRIMVAVKSAGIVPEKIIGEALRVYATRWMPGKIEDAVDDSGMKHRLLLEKIVSLLPAEKGSVSCGFLLRILKAANLLNASNSSKVELARRVGIQLEEAAVSDLLIHSSPSSVDDDQKKGATLYDVDMVMSIVEEFMLQGQSPPTSPPRENLRPERRRRSRSAENFDLENGRRSSASASASHGSKLRVAKLVDGYLQEIAMDPNLPMEKLLALATAVPDFARPLHDDLYRAIDAYLRTHPELDKSGRKELCRILNCRKLSVEACMDAAQNELLPLRVVVQVLFFEQARSATTAGHPGELPAIGIKASKLHQLGTAGMPVVSDDNWSISDLKCQASKIATLKMKLEEDEGGDDDSDEDSVVREGLMKSASSRFRSFCAIPGKPKRMLSKLWPVNRSVSERH